MKPESNLNFGFVVILPDRNYGRLQSTINSLKCQYPNAPAICVTDDTTPDEDVEEMKQLCSVVKGRNTVTSLINEGMKSTEAEWNIFLMGGTFVTKGMVRRLLAPVCDPKDILYSVYAEYDKQGRPVHIHNDFTVSGINGMTIHKDTFQKVGEFTDNPMEVSKLLWGLEASDQGCVFKGVLGAKVI